MGALLLGASTLTGHSADRTEAEPVADEAALGAVGAHGQLQVCGLKLCDEDGQPVQLTGMSSHGLQWYDDCLTDASLDALAQDWNADVLRVSMYVQEGGYETDPRRFTDRVHELIDEGTRRGLYVIVDWHMLTPGDPNHNTGLALDFFAEIAAAHADKDNVLYEIANEPNGVPWSAVRSYSEQVIPVIREEDPEAVVLVGTRAWSSLGVSEGADRSEIVADPVDADNIMYVFHFYAASHSGTHFDVFRQAARSMIITAAHEVNQGQLPHTDPAPGQDRDFHFLDRIADRALALAAEGRLLLVQQRIGDTMANAAFWIGLMTGLGSRIEDVTRHMAFEHARHNFLSAARQGLGAQFTWLDGEEIAALPLIADRLLPIANEGLAAAGVEAADRERYLGILERRVRSGRTGSRWLLFSLAAMKEEGTLGERLNALTMATVARQRAGLPVSEWEPAARAEGGGWKHNYVKVEQFMTTDLYTVHEDDPVELAAHLMEWHRIRHVPVEDREHRLVGLVSYRTLLRLLSDHGDQSRPAALIPVGEVMKRDPVVIGPETTTRRAIAIMRERRVGCLPVVHGKTLVGIVTEHDFTEIAGQLLEEKLGH